MSKRHGTYLSVDIDFWWSAGAAIRGVWEILQFAEQRRLPVNVVMNHQQMLKFVSQSGARTLINLDQHSDIADDSIDNFNCGTWISFVEWRKKGSYLWLRNNDSTHIGSCNGLMAWNEGSDWKSVDSKHFSQKFQFKDLFDNSIREIGICLSPSYTEHRVYDAIYPVLRESGHPYFKGRKNEYFGRDVVAPRDWK